MRFRLSRLAFIFAAAYLALIGGSVYYYQVFPIRVLHHAVMTVLPIVWLLNRLRKGTGIPSTPLNPLLAALVGVWILAGVFSLDPRSAFENLWFPLTHLVLFLIIADLIGRGRELLVIETFFLITAIVSMFALAQFFAWYTGIDLMPEAGVGWLNVGIIIPPEAAMLYIPLGVSTWLAGFAAPTLIVALGWAFSSTRRSYRLVFFGLAGALMLVLIGTFSRGGFVAAAAGVTTLIGLRVLRSFLPDQVAAPKRSQVALLIPAAALMAVVVALILWIGRAEARSSGDDLRFGLWRGAASIIAGDPLTGVGSGLFARAYREIRSPGNVDDRLSTAHNAYLNNTAETGLPGLLVMSGLAFVIVTRWWALWRRANTHSRQRCLEGAMAGLIALGLQSIFDTFLFTPLVLVSLVLIAYCTIEPGSLLAVKSLRSSRWRQFAAVALTLMFIAYGVAFFQFDRAHALFNHSVRNNDLEAAQAAHDLDPYLNLYQLQIAYLQSDVVTYEQALALEPTWETGWINLAAVAEQQGDIDAALDYLTHAINIRYENLGALNWARIADAHDAAPDADIVLNYHSAMTQQLPLSDYWVETERRREALAQYMRDETLPLEWRYRVAALRDPQYAASLVTGTPITAAEWWVLGEHTLSIEGDAQRAANAFTEAIQLDSVSGDYYVSRARAELTFDAAAAQRDLDIAGMLYTFNEYPNAVRIALANTPDEIRGLRAAAVPARIIDQNFEGVLFQGRVASFDIFPQMRRPGIGTAALQAWYDLAADYEANGQIDAAINVYRALVDTAPAENRAVEALARLMARP